MAKDHRPKQNKPFVFAPDGVQEAKTPPSTNPMPAAPSKYAMRPGVFLTPEQRKKWDAYWEGVESEFDAWNMHYKRSKWGW